MLSLHGMVDAYYALNSNRPPDGASFVPGTGTTAKRANEFALNMVALEMGASRGPAGARVVLGFGNGMEVLHAAEPVGVATGPDVLRNVLTAVVSFAPTQVPGLVLELGKFPSPVGMESMLSKDNWNYTRSWMGEFSPYYLAGARASWTFLKHVTAGAAVVNGWQNVGENNPFKSVMTQLTWNSDLLTVSWNTLTGPELPGSEPPWTPLPPSPDNRIRQLHDIILTLRPSPQMQFAVQADAALQHAGSGVWQPWSGLAGYGRFLVAPWLAVALRAEVFADPTGAISSTRQLLAAATATVELVPTPFFSFKVEARSDQSSAPVFGAAPRGPEDGPAQARSQGLLALGAVAHF